MIFRDLYSQQRGVSIVEYVILLALIGAVAIWSVRATGNENNEKFVAVRDEGLSSGEEGPQGGGGDGCLPGGQYSHCFGSEMFHIEEQILPGGD